MLRWVSQNCSASPVFKIAMLFISSVPSEAIAVGGMPLQSECEKLPLDLEAVGQYLAQMKWENNAICNTQLDK